MSKTISVDFGNFRGSVTIADPLKGLSIIIAWRDALRLAIKEAEDKDEKLLVGSADHMAALFPVALRCVESMAVTGVPDNVTIDTFPVSPWKDAAPLIATIVGAVQDVIDGVDREVFTPAPPATDG